MKGIFHNHFVKRKNKMVKMVTEEIVKPKFDKIKLISVVLIFFSNKLERNGATIYEIIANANTIFSNLLSFFAESIIRG